jgi:hypothetical protein
MVPQSLFGEDKITFVPKETVLLLLTRTRIGMTRKIDLDKLKDLPEKLRNDLLSANARILFCKELQEIQSLDSSMDRWIWRYSNPSIFKGLGIRLFATEMISSADGKLSEYRDARWNRVTLFTYRFRDIVAEMREKLGTEISNAINWPDPDTIEAQFTCRWRWLQIDVPEKLPTDVEAREKAKAESFYKMQMRLVAAALRYGLKDLVDNLIERLTPDESGKPKIFRDTLITNFRDFIDAFPSRYIVEDKPLEELVNRANALLNGVKPDDMRADRSVVESVRIAMSSIKEQLDTLAPANRAITFDD